MIYSKWTLLFFLLILLSLLSVFFGPTDWKELTRLILIEFRFPRTMANIWVGAALAISGVLLQTLLDNPLAEPYTLGLSGGATLGAVGAISLALTPDWIYVPLGAAIGCVTVTFVIFKISQNQNLWKSKSIILVGLLISLFCGSLVVFIMSLSDPYTLQKSMFWMMGQVGTERDKWWPFLTIIVLFSLHWAVKNSIGMDRLLLGEEIAMSLGTRLIGLRGQVIIVVSLLTTMSVTIVGLLGFVGIIAPHIARRWMKMNRHRSLVFSSAIIGACLTLSADILARLVGGEQELPTGSLMALIGAPLLIYLLLFEEKNQIDSST